MAQNVIEVIARGRDLVTPQLNKVSSSLTKLEGKVKSVGKSVFSLRSAFVALAAGFTASKIKDLALFTANVDLLRLSMEQLARTQGINVKFLNATVTVMKSMGIATDDAIKSLNTFIRTNLDLTKATKFVRVAQDLAVISLRTTSGVVERLTRGIQTQQIRVLRTAGVFTTLEEATERWRKENDRATGSLTSSEKQSALFNEVLRQGAKAAGTYEASLSFAGKKVLQLNRLWKEAQLALGDFTQDALKVGVESIQDFLKSIVNLRQSGQLDEFGKSMTATLLLVVNTIKSLSNAVIESGKFLFEWRGTILLVAEAFIAWKIIGSVIGSIKALNTALLLSQGSTLLPFIDTVQKLTVEFGLLGAASISLATALTIAGTALVGFGVGKLIGDLIATSSAMESLRDRFNEAADRMVASGERINSLRFTEAVSGFQEFVNEWIFGSLLVQDLEKETTRLIAENIQQRIALRLKEAKKVQEELAAEEQARRRVNNAEDEFLRALDAVDKAIDKSLTKGQRQIFQINELRDTLLVTAEVLKAAEPGTFIDPEALANSIAILDELKIKSEQEELIRQQELRVQLLEGIEEGNQAELELIELQNEQKMALVERFGIDKEAAERAFTRRKEVRELLALKKNLAVTAQFASLTVGIARDVNAILVAEGDEKSRTLFAIEKAAAIASAIVNTALGVTQALAIPAGPPLSFILAGITAAAGAAQIGVIAATAFAEGGIVDGATLALVGERGPEAIIPLDSPRAAERLGGFGGESTIIIEKIEMFPNITEADALLDLPDTVLERWARTSLLPVLDSLNERSLRPETI